MSEPTWKRIPPGQIVTAMHPGTRAWQRHVPDGHLSVLVGRELTDMPNGDRLILWHLSISHRSCEPPHPPGRYPTWDEIHQARYHFMPDDITVAMLLPPKAEYLNIHNTTFHLWELTP